MPVSYSSVARNLFLLGASGADAVVNFFKSVDKSPVIAFTEGQFVPSGGIKYDQDKFLISGRGYGNDSFVWIDKRDYNVDTSASTADWENRIQPTVYSSYITLEDMELDSNSNVIVVGKSGGVNGDYGSFSCYIVKYNSAGVLQWQSTSNTGDLEYTGVTSDSNGNYYACGNTPNTFAPGGASGEAVAFVEKFDGSGAPLWGKSAIMLGRDVVLKRISANSRGEVVAVGYIEDDSVNKGYIVKIDTNTGKVLWDRTLERSIAGSAGTIPADVRCTSCYIDSNDQIYIVGSVDGNNPVNNGVGEFLIKYTAEGNIVWQRENNTDHYTALDGAPNMIPFDVWSDGETEQTVVLSVQDQGSFALNDSDVFISKYNRNGDIVFRRKISKGGDNLGTAAIDGDPSYYYMVFRDQQISGLEPDRYTFGKVSSSGNGLGTFSYNDGSGSGDDVDYIAISNPENKIGKMSDGSVSNNSSDLMSYPFTANKLLFDDLATHVSNKKRQMDSADSFEYSGSPAIRPADFQELNLLGDVYSGSGDWLDQSGKGNDGIIPFSGPFIGSGSLNFPGGNTDRLEIANSADFNFGTGAYTIEMFIKTTAAAGWLYHENDPNDSGMRLCVGTNGSTGSNDGRIEFNEQVSNGDNAIQGTTQINDGEWHHIAVVRGASGDTTKLYVDGVLDATGSANRNFDSNDTLYIGARGTYGGNEYAGEISNLRVVKGVQVYTGNFTPPSEPLTDITGTSLLIDGSSITDISSNARTITTVGSITSKNPSSTHNAAGYWEFDGVDDGITIPYTPKLAFTDAILSCEAWIYADTLVDGGQEFSIINKRGNNATQNGNRPYVLGVNGDGKVRFILDGATTVCDTATGLIQTGQWYHIAATHDGSNAKIYVNSILRVNVSSGTSSLTDTGDIPTRIGWRYKNSSINYNDGRIGEVRIYDRVLTTAQVYQNYNATQYKYTGIRPSTSPRLGSTVVLANGELNYDFGNGHCIEKSSLVSPPTYETIIDDATTNGAAFGDGQCVATGYGKVVVGARGETNGVYTAGGKAYIYNAKTGALEVTLTPSDISGNDWNFGNAVAICNCSGKIAVTSSSALYLYDADGTNEIIIDSNSTLPISPPGGNTFGNGLAISGNRVWVSDDNVPTGPNYNGTVYCFNAETGAFLYELRPKNTFNNFTNYGTRIVAGDGKLAIGADSITHPVTGRSSTGRVYLYDVDGRNEKILEPDTLTTSSLFGLEGIAISDGLLVVGASRQQRTEDPLKIGSGEVYVFDMNGDLKFSIRPSDDPANEDVDAMGFGSSVAISSDRIIVGAQYYVGNPGGVAGRAYQFTHTGNEIQAWIGTGGLDSSGDASNFGSSMDAVSGTLVIGASSGSPDSSGRAYIYPLTNTPSGTIKNLSSSSYTGTITGPVFDSAGYFDFDGTNDTIGLGSTPIISSGSFTYEAWGWVDAFASGDECSLINYEGTNLSTLLLSAGSNFDGGVGHRFVVRKDNTNEISIRGNIAANGFNEWHHYVGVYDETTQTAVAYVDGVQVNTGTNTNVSGWTAGTTSRQDLGVSAGGVRHLDGRIGETRIYDQALTATEVSKNFNATRGKYGV